MVKIKEAAIKKDGTVFTGKRHADVMRKMVALGIKPGNQGQGFVTEEGKFVDRKEAEVIARACGQIKGKLIGSVLTSEDLY